MCFCFFFVFLLFFAKADSCSLGKCATNTAHLDVTQLLQRSFNIVSKRSRTHKSNSIIGRYVPGSDGTYSQNYQDEWVAAVARHNGWDHEDGFFLDLGAFDGLKCSNSALIEKTFGWKGVCVEPRPLPGAFEQRTCTLVKRPLSDLSNKVVKFYGQIGTQLQHVGVQMDTDQGTEEEMRTLSATDLIECLNSTHASSLCDNVPRGQHIPDFIHFVSLDIEGQDRRFLSTFPFDRVQVGAWVVEASGDDDANILAKHGYARVPVSNPGVDQYFVQPRFWHESLAKHSWRIHPEGSEC
mmetsp:Transcript_45193/g.81725  ORF Transcript_45193/g.81725 Transcript_45193/m.81725 type:complete len:296 (-) Transcript_45193:27-914(-)